MKDRPTSDHDRRRLKAATERGIKRAGGGSMLAEQTRVEAAQLSKYKAVQEDAAFMPIDVAVDCDMVSGSPVILSTMASLLGYSVAPCAPERVKYAPELVGTLIRETGEVSAVILEAMADGKLTEAERAVIAKEIDDATLALWRLRASLLGA
ncbi:phage regulatory CII family protein [Mesorhizobium sp. KR2-14]|uniref:phage regulatory CII family protein n=1 Tax=Mesorhizobium sp. KR2-14 TaxID=3156610 RepID=UPI0032B59B67